MMQVLFYVPAALGGIPLFGWGWLLTLWLVLGGAGLAWHIIRHGWSNGEASSHLVSGFVVAAVIVFLQRMVVVVNGVALGIPIRGYGVFLLLGIVAGVGLALYRSRCRGIPSEVIQNLAVWMFVAGIVGARVFYVAQNWSQFHRETWLLTLWEVFRVTEGGLVVYGSLIGAGLAFVTFCYRYRLPTLALADLVAPSLLLGLAFGRIGCLMNGCCYGGQSELPWAITFPAHVTTDGPPSPVYWQQLSQGVFDGFVLAERDEGVIVAAVDEQGPAAQAGLQVGGVIAQVSGINVDTVEHARQILSQETGQRTVQLTNGHVLAWPLDLPPRSRPVHPTQIYSSINALVLLWFILAYEPFARRDGLIIAITLTLYPLTRALLEVIRTDESNFGATGLTISQNVSLIVLLLVSSLWYVVWSRPPTRAWPTLEG